jgi:anti-sigma-K factor RskA
MALAAGSQTLGPLGDLIAGLIMAAIGIVLAVDPRGYLTAYFRENTRRKNWTGPSPYRIAGAAFLIAAAAALVTALVRVLQR